MYTDIKGNEIRIGKELGHGGEASVFAIEGNDSIVAKIYNDSHPIDAQKLEKLEKMCALFNGDISEYYAWPQKIIYSNNRAVGFLMENINTPNKSSKYLKFIKYYQWKDRRKLFPNAEYKFVVHSALNLARAVETLHEKDIVIGDINESNVFVNNIDTTIKLIDCDSYQIEDFLCDVGTLNYTAPELPIKLRGVRRTKNNDYFALAVMIFQILVGKHPYEGINTHLNDIRLSITEGLYCYGKDADSKNICPPYPFSETYNALSEKIKNLFEQAFTSTNRPTAKDWIDALSKYESELIPCSHDSHHFYHQSSKSCVWCEIQEKGYYAFGMIQTQSKKIQQNHIQQTQYQSSLQNIQQTQNVTANTVNNFVNKYVNQQQQKNQILPQWIKYILIIVLVIITAYFFSSFVPNAKAQSAKQDILADPSNYTNQNSNEKQEVRNAKNNIKMKFLDAKQACVLNNVQQCSLYFNDYYNVLKKYESSLSTVFPLTTEELNNNAPHEYYGIKFISHIEKFPDCEIYGSGCIKNVDIDDEYLKVYKVIYSGEGYWSFAVNSQLLYDNFYNYLNRAWQNYLIILNKEQKILGNNDFYIDGATFPSKKDLAQWIIDLQKFNRNYPNFAQKQEIQEKIDLYTSNLIRSQYSTFSDTGYLLPEAKEALIYFLQNANPNTDEYYRVREAYNILKKYNFKFSDEFGNSF